MSEDLFIIRSSAIPDGARVVAFKGVEAISKAYHIDVDILVADSVDFELDHAIGKRATLHTMRGEKMPLNGVIAAVELMNQFQGHSIYRLSLRPRFWQLTLSEHSRVFVNQSLPEIIEDVLKRAGFGGDDYEMKLESSYPKIDHVCQYHESSFAFVSRWMERDGIYYFFEQKAHQEKLIITDAKSGHPECFKHPVRFFPLHGHDVTAPPSLQSFKCRFSALPASVQLTDYDYIKPSLALEGTAPVVKNGPDDIVRYGDNFLTPGEGEKLAKIRAEELLVGREVFTAHGSQLDLHSGHVFLLEDHPRVSFNQKYLLTHVEHYGNQSANSQELREMLGLEHEEVYRVNIRAIRATVQYRSACDTRVPRIYSMENAVVDGEADSEYAQIDEYGRYKVKIKFDEGDLKNGKASMWIRMLQPHGGNPEGFHFPLRKGTEVLLIFLGGDPDRPVIAGVGPNTHKPSPIVLSNHTKNVIQTGGLNRFEMEDLAGGQYTNFSTPTENTFFHMGAPKEGAHLYQNTNGDNLVKIGGDRTIRVQGDRLEHVNGDVTERVLGDKMVTTTGDVTRHYQSSFKHTVDSNVNLKFNANEMKKVLGSLVHQIEGSVTKEVTGAVEHKFSSTMTQLVSASTKLVHDADLLVKSASDMVHQSGTLIHQKAPDHQIDSDTAEWNIAGLKFEHTGQDNSIVDGEKIEITGGAILEVTAGAKAEIVAAATMEIFVGGQLEITAGGKKELHPIKSQAHAAHLEETAMKQLTAALEQYETGLADKQHGLESMDAGLRSIMAALHSLA